MQQVLIIQNSHTDPYGYIGILLEEFALPHVIVDAETRPLPDPRDYAAVIAFGGAQHVYETEKNPQFTAEEAVLRQIVAQDIPYLGICLAGQLLASAFGGTVKKHHSSEIGFYDIPLTAAGQADPLYKDLPGYQKVFHWHEDTFDLPEEGILLASNTHTPNQAFRYGRRAYGFQYHVEITPSMLYGWLHDPNLTEEELGKAAIARIESESAQQFTEYQNHTRTMFTNFLRLSGLL